jgi:Sulfotransferase domain
MLPNFLIIGAARSGTSTLYRYLQVHPQVYLRPDKRPEPHFFFKDSEYAKGLRYYESRWFPLEGKWRAVGEASTSYLFGSKVPPRIAQALPSVRLIAVLRNPIDRAFSNYWHSVRSGLETLSFEQAIEREAERSKAIEGTPLEEVKPYSYVARGFYHAQIARFLAVLARSQLAILTFDDLTTATASVVRDVYRFLGVDHSFVPPHLDLVENRSVPNGAKMDPKWRRRLAGIYSDDICCLGKLLGRDLAAAWLQ